MSYYETIDEDLRRARAILARGKEAPPDLEGFEHISFGGTIYGGDTYAAYMLLASFVEEIEELRAAIKVDEQTITHNIATIEEQNATIVRLRADAERERFARRVVDEALRQALLHQSLDK